jgi:NADH-quinone oxidoreductase subunit K
MELTTNHFLFLSAALFIIGMMGVLTRRNVLVIFMCVEMMVAAVSITLIAFGNETNTLNGQVFVLFAIAIAAAESAVGLAIVVALARQGKAPDINQMQALRD